MRPIPNDVGPAALGPDILTALLLQHSTIPTVAINSRIEMVDGQSEIIMFPRRS